jgi:hypothetical protein
MANYDFAPAFEILSSHQSHYPIADLERERGVYSATPTFVRAHCGDIACHLLASVPDAYYAEAERLHLFPNCDVRIHRLYPGDVPAYPGWHCDGEYRGTYFSQPDLDRIKVSKHITAHVSSCADGVSCTQFLNEPFSCEVREQSAEHTLWGQVHAAIERKQAKAVFDIRDGQLVQFDSWSLHRAMPARVRGWRLFFRMSMWHRPNLGEGGMITKQEQVYKLVEGSGW